jgi:phage shock protein B
MGTLSAVYVHGPQGILGMGFVEMIVMMVLAIPLVAIIGGTLVALVKVVTGSGSREDSRDAADEARMIQEIHEGLMRMEERVEALETLMLDRDRTEKKGNRR